MHRTPRILRTPDLSQPQTAFPTYASQPAAQGSVPDFLAARLHNVFGQNLDMAALVSRSRAAVLDTAQVSAAIAILAALLMKRRHFLTFGPLKAPQRLDRKWALMGRALAPPCLAPYMSVSYLGLRKSM